MIASIPKTSLENDVTYYHINIKIPLRSITTLKRFSDFYTLVNSLCSSLKINFEDFPYELPPKKLGSRWFSRGANSPLVQERTLALTSFLNNIIQDRELQNEPLVHDFLKLPLNFKFTEAVTKPKSNSDGLSELILPSDLKLAINWQEYPRKFKYHLGELSSEADRADNISKKLEIRAKVTKVIKPNLLKLEEAIGANSVDELEVKRRNIILSDISSQLDSLLKKLDINNSTSANSTKDRNGLFGNRRVFGGSTEQAIETNETLPLNNQELLQQQIQVQKNQDHEIEELRKIIRRQRQIGETIIDEVGQQNDLLDELSNEVDKTSDKLRTAKVKARKFA